MIFSKLTFYLAKEYLSFLFSWGFFLLLFILSIDYLTQGHPVFSIKEIIITNVTKAPFFVKLLFPFLTSLSLVLTLKNLRQHREMIGLQASAISQQSVYLKLFFITAMVSIVFFPMIEKIIQTSYQKISLQDHRSIFNFFSHTRENKIKLYSNKIITLIDSYDKENQTLKQIELIQNEKQTKTIFKAKTATYKKDWIFYNVEEHLIKKKGITTKFYKKTTNPLFQLSLKDLDHLSLLNNYLPLRKIPKIISLYHKQNKKSHDLQLTLYERLSFFITPLLFALVIFFADMYFSSTPLTLRFTMALFFVGIYFIFWRSFLSFGRNEHLSPLVACWTPAVTLLSGLFLVYIYQQVKKRVSL